VGERGENKIAPKRRPRRSKPSSPGEKKKKANQLRGKQEFPDKKKKLPITMGGRS